MKAKLEKTGGGGQLMLTLVPESKADEDILSESSRQLSRVHIINSRGFKYLSPEIEFLIQPCSDSK